MCGIGGILGHPISDASLQGMAAALAHRGPDGQGIWSDPAAGLGLVHRRLSIIDLSADGHQPMADASGRQWVVFNGEIYNHRELRAELAGYPFRSRSDTEVILAAYQRWGESCVEHFIGMFAFALWDGRTRTLFCARDRLGVKPFVFARDVGGRFLFASEVKALLAAGLPAEPDWSMWADYMVHGSYEHGERTFFAGVHQLPAGHLMVVAADGTIRQRRYWDVAERALAAGPLELDLATAGARVRELVEDSVRLRKRSDVPVAVSLSGGLDSSVVACTLARQEPETARIAFTANHGDRRYDEDGFARNFLGPEWRHVVVTLGAGAVAAQAEQAIVAQEAPFGGIATLALHNLHQTIRREGIKVVLEGQGGDEAFGGYANYLAYFLCDVTATRGWRGGRAAAKAMARGAQVVTQARRVRDGGGAAFYQDGTSYLDANAVAPELRALARQPVQEAPFASALTSAQYRDVAIGKLPRVLRMNDRLSMAQGVELRQPLLDHRILELAFRLPGAVKIHGDVGKQVLRAAFCAVLPPGQAYAAKRAVVTPQREWLVGPLASWVEDLVFGSGLDRTGLIVPAAARTVLADLAAGRRDNSFPVWQWVNAALWFRHFAKGSRSW
ncbi:MAG: asparagine synthase (glutamine-hydrolyzing) [Magnetospirillum sp.]|nr:asparagine synthase (glutamine-hydrolyzing) [Magnetospirillum sp.]